MDRMEEHVHYSEEEYEERRALRQQKWEATKRRQQRLQKLFFGGIGCLLALIGMIVFVVVHNSGKKEKQATPETNLQTDQISTETVLSELAQSDLTVEESLQTEAASGDVTNYESLPMDDWRFVGLEIPKWEVVSTAKYATALKIPADYISLKSDRTQGLYSEEVTSQYALLVNVTKHDVVADKNGFDTMYPASMTKIMTILVASDYLTDLEDTVTITEDVTTYVWKNDCSSVGFSVGEVVTIQDLLYGTILPSGGDAAYALAVYVAGSQEAFVGLMNEKAGALGIGDTTHFTNCVGVYDANHYSRCADIAIILEAAMDNPLCNQVLSQHKYVTGKTMEHPEGIEVSNWFLRRIEDKDCGGLVLGAKTGFVNESGCCGASYFIAENGDTYICVTGNAHSSWRCIYDHVAVYNIYAIGNTGYRKQ